MLAGALAGALTAAAVVLVVAAPTAAQASEVSQAATPSPYARLEIAKLRSLPVKGRAPKTGYSRAQFGPAWKDVDHNGCDTRNDILNRDLVRKTKSGKCIVLTGVLYDRYSASILNFRRGTGTSTQVQIDHLVSLSNAWQTGAQRISANARLALANDPLNLQATIGRLNEQKGDGDAATWLPPNKAYRCTYVARQVDVKKKYGLWVTSPERAAIEGILARC